MYFSPVNFYIGFDKAGYPSHLLAEVSNTPWNKRHYYGFLLEGEHTTFKHNKGFHVSPFNPLDQVYTWQVDVEQEEINDKIKNNNGLYAIKIGIYVSDARGEVFSAGVNLQGKPMTRLAIIRTLKANPMMNFSSMLRIYVHAFRLYVLKKVPYINYDEHLNDSLQSPKLNTKSKLLSLKNNNHSPTTPIQQNTQYHSQPSQP